MVPPAAAITSRPIRGASGEADHVDARVGRQNLARLDAARRDDVDHPGRNIGVFVDDSRERQACKRRER